MAINERDRGDVQAIVGRWLYFHGFSRLGSWLYTRSRTWHNYVAAQYGDETTGEES